MYDECDEGDKQDGRTFMVESEHERQPKFMTKLEHEGMRAKTGDGDEIRRKRRITLLYLCAERQTLSRELAS